VSADTLFFSENKTRPCFSRSCDPHRKQRIDGCDRMIAVDRHVEAFAKRTRYPVHSPSTVGSHSARPMNVAPVVDVINEEIDADTELRHSNELRPRGHLAVFETVTVSKARMLFEHLFNGVEGGLCRKVTIGVKGELESCLVQRTRESNNRAGVE